MKFRAPNGEFFKNEALYEIFENGKTGLCTPMESRIVLLYQLLEKGIMPWMWDYENYKDSDMIGFFYPEDYNAIIQIQQLEGERNRRQK